MKRIFILVIIFLPLVLKAQYLTPAVLSSGSSDVQTQNISFSFTLAELVTPSFYNGNILTQGFLQPVEKKISTNNNTHVSAKIYPNPAAEKINLMITVNQKITKIDVIIYNLLSIECYQGSFTEISGNHSLTSIPITMLTAGQYFIKITINEQFTYVSKFIKMSF